MGFWRNKERIEGFSDFFGYIIHKIAHYSWSKYHLKVGFDISIFHPRIHYRSRVLV